MGDPDEALITSVSSSPSMSLCLVLEFRRLESAGELISLSTISSPSLTYSLIGLKKFLLIMFLESLLRCLRWALLCKFPISPSR